MGRAGRKQARSKAFDTPQDHDGVSQSGTHLDVKENVVQRHVTGNIGRGNRGGGVHAGWGRVGCAFPVSTALELKECPPGRVHGGRVLLPLLVHGLCDPKAGLSVMEGKVKTKSQGETETEAEAEA